MLDGNVLLRQKRDEVPKGTLSCPDRIMEFFYQLRHYEGSHLLLSVCGWKLIQQTQISKIQWVISNFENVCFWSRESIILYWKRMGWKETWHKSSPWHFAFEYKRVNEQDYIFIQDAEHHDDIKESSFNLKTIVR